MIQQSPMSKQETRVANDGKQYTWDQFVGYYPDDINWYWYQASGAVEDGKSLKAGGE